MNTKFWKNIWNKGKVKVNSFQNFAFIRIYLHLKEFRMETRLSNIFKTTNVTKFTKAKFYKLHSNGKR